MSANVISHRAPHRKRARPSMVRRAGVVIVAIAGVIFASLLANAPDRAPNLPQHLPSRVAQSRAHAPATAVVVAVDTAADLTRAPLPRRSVRSVRQTGVPLDADAALEPAGYEILSAAELDGISQARE
jgi:hypothetical protein